MCMANIIGREGEREVSECWKIEFRYGSKPCILIHCYVMVLGERLRTFIPLQVFSLPTSLITTQCMDLNVRATY